MIYKVRMISGATHMVGIKGSSLGPLDQIVANRRRLPTDSIEPDLCVFDSYFRPITDNTSEDDIVKIILNVRQIESIVPEE